MTDTNDAARKEEVRKYLQPILSKMMPLINSLDLKNKTEDEMREEILLDFSTLPPVIPADEILRTKVLLNLYGMQLRSSNVRTDAETLYPSDRKKYDLSKFNNGIVALGVQNFMAAATHFCDAEAAGGQVDIVSVGSGDGTVERSVIAEYGKRFGKSDLRIKLVDPDPKYDGIVDFKTVDHLIEQNPRVVGNCVAFIIWPNPIHEYATLLSGGQVLDHDLYDVKAVLKLQPKAALVLYECFGGSASDTFRSFLHDDSIDRAVSGREFGMANWMNKFHSFKIKTHGLDNYTVTEIARQKLRLPGRDGTYMVRLVKLIRTNN